MLVIAIAGGSGSGKTSVAQELYSTVIESGYQCEMLCEDSYYHSISAEQLADIANVNFDHPDAIDHAQLKKDIDQLKQGHLVETPLYSYKTHQRLTDTHPVHPADVFILEGLHILHRRNLLPLYDVTVFVDTPTEVRLERRMYRDIRERQRTPESVIAQFNSTVEPCHQEFVQPSQENAEIKLDGTKPLKSITPQLIEKVFKLLTARK